MGELRPVAFATRSDGMATRDCRMGPTGTVGLLQHVAMLVSVVHESGVRAQ